MQQPQTREKLFLEIMLIGICLGLTCLLYAMQGYKMVILNLFFLPVALGGFFLGRYRAGVLTVFCVISASLVTALRLADLSAAASPLVIGLAVAVWAAVLGLTAMLVGSLSDDRAAKLLELHEAYVGVVEVLSQYLQSAHPHLKARSIQVAELSQQVAAAMKLSPREIDDIRVAALLYDMGNIEVTTRVIRRAVGTFEDESGKFEPCTFQGMDLMLSLGSVLSGAVPLLLNQDEDAAGTHDADRKDVHAEVPLGANIIRAVRAFALLSYGSPGEPVPNAAEIVAELRSGHAGHQDPDVLAALEIAVSRIRPGLETAHKETPSQQPEEPAEVAAG